MDLSRADAPGLSSAPLHVLVGRALDQAVGERLRCEPRPSALRDLLLAQRSVEAPDAWLVLGAFEADRRRRDAWQSAGGLTLDLDWEDPTLPKEEGAHEAISAPARAQIRAALLEYGTPGVAYLTPRGVRVMHVLAAPVDAEERYEDLVVAASDKLLAHLREWAVPLWRDGVTGLRFDPSSTKPSQAMRLPLADAEVLLTGEDCEVCETELEGSGGMRMDLDAALPHELADACRQIARWVQISVEVVVTGLIAWACATVGNTRWVEARGLQVPLSLHFVTVLPAGSGKGTVRGYLKRATHDIEREIVGHRMRARKERAQYEDLLATWRSDGRSVKRRDQRGPQPEPPELSPDGGERVSFVVSEANLEGIIATLEDTPRGFLWASDEAHEILGMLGRYGDGGAARSLDAARLRRLMDSSPVEAHRAKSNSSPVRRMPRPWLALDMDVQPEVLESLFTGEDRVSGLLARFFLHAPPPTQGSRRYVQAPPEPGPEVLALLTSKLRALWRCLLKLEDGTPSPETMELDEQAERLWAQELERFERLYPGAGSEETGVLGHARGRLLRLAGVLTLLRDPKTLLVTEGDMRRAITHVRYYLSQHRALVARGNEPARARRLDHLREQVERLLEKQPNKGVRPRDLARRVSKDRYAGEAGLRRAYADLHAIGWILRRPKPPKGKPGRPPVPAFFQPTEETRNAGTPREPSHKPQEPGAEGLGGLGYSRREGDAARNGAAALLERASAALLGSGEVALPRPGTRTACPACGSPDGLGVLPDDERRWYCHSDRHDGPRGGCAVDYLLAQRMGRMPSVGEAVEEAARIVGEARA